jgi:hypothetical protein
VCATCPVHPILLDLNTLRMFDESTDFEVSYYAVFSSFLLPPSIGPNILLSTLFSNTLNLSERPSYTLTLNNRCSAV